LEGPGPAAWDVRLEDPITHLGEPTSTSVDVLFRNGRRIAVECKFAEEAFGACSRPSLAPTDGRHCDGTYTIQGGRKARCSLTAIGVKYWTYVPTLFTWSAEDDHRPCPLAIPYQLVRNVLAACVSADGSIDPAAHALVLYDARNPAFQGGGGALGAYE